MNMLLIFVCFSVRPDMSEPLNLSATSSAPLSESSIFTTDLAGLPPYQAEDPLKPFASLQDKTSQSSSRELISPSCSINPSTGASLALPNREISRHSRFSTTAQMGSMSSLAPPEDESEAPPTYEEAVSTVV